MRISQNNMAFVAVVILILELIALSFVLTTYICQGIAITSISKRRNLGTPGFGWIPFLSFFQLGKIADDAALVMSGKNTKYRIWFLLSTLLLTIVSIIESYTKSMSHDVSFYLEHQEKVEQYAQIAQITAVINYIFLIITVVLYVIILYYIYKAGTSSYVVFTILSIFIPLFAAFALVGIKNNDSDFYKPHNGNDSGYRVNQAVSFTEYSTTPDPNNPFS